MRISFTVFGKPEPQGSTKAFIPKGWKRAVITSDNKNTVPWRQQITRVAIDEMEKLVLNEPAAREVAVHVRMVFYLRRPDSLAKKFTRHTKKPDWDKLSRAVCDSLTGSVFVDDSQITDAVVSKRYGFPERVEITICSDRAEFKAEKSVAETYELFANT